MTDETPPKSGRARGGFARARALTPEARSASARKAALERWKSELPYATHEGILNIAGVGISVAVLNTGQRVITQSGFMRALGRARQAKGRQYYKGDVNLPAFLTAQNLKPFVSNVLEVTSSQIEFRPKAGGAVAFGYADTLLPEVCNVFVKADRAGVLTKSQAHIADQAHNILMGLAVVGISGLIDEVTGYQEVRDRNALQAIIDTYFRKQFASWAKKFPDEFYRQIFRLKGWEWKGRSFNPPQVVAHYTKDIVYHRLAPNIVKELETKNPLVNGRRKVKHFQWLSDEVGHPALDQHLHTVINFMKSAEDWEDFKRRLDLALPRLDETMQLPLFENEPRRVTSMSKKGSTDPDLFDPPPIGDAF